MVHERPQRLEPHKYKLAPFFKQLLKNHYLELVGPLEHSHVISCTLLFIYIWIKDATAENRKEGRTGRTSIVIVHQH